jgi:hypothetical protein
MLSKIAGLVKGEMTRAAAVFVSAQSTFLSLLKAYRDKMPTPPEAEAEAEVEVVEPEAGTSDTEAEIPDADGAVEDDREGVE